MHRRAVSSLDRADPSDSTETFRLEEDLATPDPTSSRKTFFSSRAGHTQSLLPRSSVLCVMSLVLHSLIVLTHLILLGIWAKRLEHRVTFSLKNQRIASFLITAISTAIGTVYSASLVFVTQTLSMRRSLHRHQMLTETHDNTVAWAGIGSAVVQLWTQKAVPASVIGVLCTFLYLANVLVLHITTPALFSLETFSAYRLVPVETRGLPTYNWSSTPGFDIIDNLDYFLPQPLSLLPSVFKGSVPALGLHNGTIYDVPIPNEGVGNVTANGTGFNITCGYIPDAVLTPLENTTSWNVTWPGLAPFYAIIYPTQPGLVVPINRTFFSSVFFYSTIPILDSSANPGKTHNLAPLMDNVTSSIQIIGCSQSLSNQTAIVDAQSREIQTLEPELQKTNSIWEPYTGTTDTFGIAESTTLNGTDTLFTELWGKWYMLIPPSDFPLVFSGTQMLSVADLQLNQMLNLVSGSDGPQSIALHTFENSLSTMVASMFWTLGNIPPAHGFVLQTLVNGQNVSMVSDTPPAGIGPNSFAFERPFLLAGNATVTAMSAETRLDLSIIAVAAGLAVSIALLLLSLPSSLFHWRNEADFSVDGTSMLQSIWLYRKHPELEALLEQVEHPTNDNLRAAGMVRTTLVGGHSRDSFQMARRG
ncbi:hypothetical protein B0H17DRAFT_1324277 [Mycena rosella]|uniref:Transmembrane protein n=1 Tax=Mycena rosella TaxID=1033263 RepID=A0AAD7H2X1_MYCRO|nr:hypothetical protein B0H17DRAFT_1324277 [Mycena rosella]